MSTTEQRQQFLERRRSGVGGSDVAAILGLSPWKGPLDVWEAKVNPLPAQPREQTEPQQWGHILEPVVAAEWARRQGVRVYELALPLQSPNDPFIGNLDRVIADDRGASVDVQQGGVLVNASGILEVKTGSAWEADEWGTDQDPGIPPWYQAQGQWYLGLAPGVQVVHFAALIGGQRLITRTMERDDALIEGLQERARRFWHEHVVTRTPPPPRTGGEAARIFRRDNGVMIDVQHNARALELIAQLRSVRASVLEGERLVDQLEDELKLLIGPASGLAAGEAPLITWKAAADSTRTNWEGVARDLNPPPEVIAKHTSTVPGSRRFLLKKGSTK